MDGQIGPCLVFSQVRGIFDRAGVRRPRYARFAGCEAVACRRPGGSV